MSTEPLDPTPDSLMDAPLGVQDEGEPTPKHEVTPDDPPKTGEELDEDGKPKKVGGFQKRISKLTTRLAAQEEELTRLRAGTPPPPATHAAEPQTSGKPEAPDEDKFSSYAEFKAAERKYVEDLVDWKADQKVTEREQAREAEAEKTKAQEKDTESKTVWTSRLDAAHEAHPDLEELLEDEDLPTSPAMSQTLMESDLGGELLYHLAKNPDECRRIAALSPLAAARELGRLEASIVEAQKSAKIAPPKKSTSAPAPLSPLKGTGTTTQDESKQSDADWLRSQRGKR